MTRGVLLLKKKCTDQLLGIYANDFAYVGFSRLMFIYDFCFAAIEAANEQCHEKTNNLVFEQVRQSELYKHRRWLEAGIFGLRE